MLLFIFLDHGTKGTNIFFQRVDGNLLIQQKVTTNIQYRIKIGRKIRSEKFKFNDLSNFVLKILIQRIVKYMLLNSFVSSCN